MADCRGKNENIVYMITDSGDIEKVNFVKKANHLVRKSFRRSYAIASLRGGSK